MTGQIFRQPLLALALAAVALVPVASAQTPVPPPPDTEPLPPQPTPPTPAAPAPGPAPAGEPAPGTPPEDPFGGPPAVDPAPPGPAPAPPPAPPPPPADPGRAQRELNDKVKAYWVGEWVLSVTQGQIKIDFDLVFRADGSFAGTQRITGYDTSVPFPLTGTWELQAIDEYRFVLVTRASDQPQSNAELQIVDQNTVYNPKDQYYARRVR